MAGTWQIEYQHNPYYYCQRLVSMITGYGIDEVIEVMGNGDKFKSSAFKNAFRALGFNCNERFTKLDIETKHPSILRSRIKTDDRHWFACVMNDGKVYIPGTGVFEMDDYFLNTASGRNCQPTSQLNVWM